MTRPETEEERAVRVNRPTLKHLRAVANVTGTSHRIALAALHESLHRDVSPGRVDQLRRVVDLVTAELRCLETAMVQYDDAPIVRDDDPAVDRAAELRDDRYSDRWGELRRIRRLVGCRGRWSKG